MPDPAAGRGRVRARWAEARLALALLTRLPVGRIAAPVPALSAAAWAFPLAGAAAAVIPAGLFWGAAAALPPGMAAVLALAAGLLVTGALHEDGLADMADGFGGGRTPARKLEIMRDSRIGSYGALALIVAMAIRIQGLALAPDGAAGAAALIAVGAASRAPMAVAMAALPAARAEGLAAGGAGAGAAAMAGALGLAALLLLPAPGALAAGLAAALAAGAGAVALIAWRQIGGQTGDVLGAVQQAGEAALWLGLAGVWRWT